MVPGPSDAGTRRTIRSDTIREQSRASAGQHRLFRICAPAEGNALKRPRPRALVLLERTVIRRDSCSRLADGPSKAACSNLSRQLTSVQTGSWVDGEVEEPGADARGHVVHDAVGGISGATAQIHR